MSLAHDLVWAVRADRFGSRARAVCDRHDLDERCRRRAREGATPPEPELDRRGRTLVRRVWTFDTAPVGLTLCGPAYRDTPVLYATRTVRRLTGYDLSELRGENPRLFQGPETEPGAVADLRAAVEAWNETTVELTNHRRDGTPVRVRVTLAPLAGDDGTVTHWLGVQRRVER
ncbi:MAG: PAS sensor histidine kinase [uncultured archaeon A07HB70]|nr:MAG: PAS sensor histidine kinase [uncultured archaeon A07HB70]